MKSHDGPDKWHGWMIRAWHLALLRFAVTRDNADRLGVFAIAAGLDGLGNRCDEKWPFGFFRKASAELCASIVRRNPTDDAILRQYLSRIDDDRLKHACTAAIGIEQRETTAIKRRTRPEDDLWRGLTSR